MQANLRKPIIFIISGKANSGKDTTASLISDNVKLKGYNHINLQFSSYIKMYASKISNWDLKEDTKPRSLLQELGTDIIRNKIDDDFFINRIIGDIKVYSYYFDIITISDARFPKEIESIKNNFENVYSINIERPDFKNKLNDVQNMHVTENALNNYDSYDYVLVNDKTIDDLNNKVINLIDEVI